MSQQRASGRSDGAEKDLADAYQELQSLLLEQPDVTGYLQQVAVLAAEAVPADSCSVTLRRDHEVTTVASSGEFASRVDEIQYGRGQGPCLRSLHTGEVVLVADLETDERWPDYHRLAFAEGVRSSLSVPLLIAGPALGALNLYGTTTERFGTEAQRRATSFGRQASLALALVLRDAKRQTLDRQLREALSSRGVIDQALGIVMAQQKCGSDEAFAILRQASQHRNVRLSVVAAELVEATSGQSPRTSRPFIER